MSWDRDDPWADDLASWEDVAQVLHSDWDRVEHPGLGLWLERADGSRAFVYYSIGNALTTQMAIPRVVSAVAQFELVGVPGGEVEVVDPAAVPLYMHFDLTPQQFVSQDWIHRRNLQLHPLVDAAEPITRSAWRNDLTVESGVALVTDVLGPDVRIVTDSFAQ